MPSKKTNSKSALLTRILSEVLGAIARPATISDITNVILLLGHGDFESFSRLSVGEVESLLQPLLQSGEVREVGGAQLQSRAWSSDELRGLFARPEYQPLPEAISRALPMVGTHGETDIENLRRDIRNAFFSENAGFLNAVLLVMRDSFPNEYASGESFDFLFDEPEEWLLSLPESFLAVCAWKLLPSAMLSLRPVHNLAERFYALSENAQPMAISSMLDYAILCGDWAVIPGLMRRLPQGRTPRMLRLAWIRFLQGRDEEAIGIFRDALELLRRHERTHDGYFRTIGGVFAILALLREGTPASLQLANIYNASALRNDTPHTLVYQLLEPVVRMKTNPELPPVNPIWRPDGRLNNLLACFAQYWLTGTLDGGQRLLLDNALQAARQGGYNWLAEEGDELQLRLQSQGLKFNRWHDLSGKLPFFLDCILTKNSWIDRYSKLEKTLEELPQKNPARIVWNINAEQNSRGILTAKPIEQHASKNGKWTKGRRYAGYRERDFGAVTLDPENPLFELSQTQLTPQDKFACDVLREAEAVLKVHPDAAPVVWSKVIQALVGHPRLFLEGGDGQILICRESDPAIFITRLDDALQYRIYPESSEGEECVVRLERGDQVIVYRFPPAMRQLRRLLSGDFRIPDVESPENKKVLENLIRNFRIVSDTPLPGVDLPAHPTDPVPFLQLIPRERGLRAELMVRPFGQEGRYYQPGEGPCELICQERGNPRRMVRNMDEELQMAADLVEACPRLGATHQEKPWQWSFEGLACYELTLQLRGLMDKCRVQWPSDQKFVCHRTLSMSNVSLHTQSYLSWFSVDGEVKLDDSEGTASLADLIQAVVDKKHFVSLSDGQVVALSESLRKRLEDLSYLGELAKGRGSGQAGRFSLRVCQFLLPFLGESISDFPGAELPPESNQWIQKYNDAMRETPPVPSELKATLRPYQEEGYLWLSRLDKAGAGACLADDMGLGKTVQAIALILARADEGPTLIVAPTSVCANWKAEFQKFAPSLNCEVFGPGDRAQVLNKLGPRHVLIASYGLLQSEQQAFKKIKWRIAVLDEAQAIKNAHAKRSQAALEIHAAFRVVTTGTPIENNLSELWSIFNFIIPGLLGSREGFQRRFAAAIEHDNSQDALKSLRGIVSPFMLRRRKDQVLNDLPPKEEIYYPVEISPDERAFYDNLRKKILADLESHDESEGQRHIRVLAGIMKLRLAVDHPRLVAGGEALHGSKLDAFLELLRRILQSNHKVLVFSQFVKFLDIVRETLDSEGISYEYLDGARTPKERAASVENFQNGDVPVFLISLKAGGLGLNLTQADYVIHLDSWWNPAVEDQASDRAHRLGQRKKVTIYHLQAINTIEDKVKALHQRKRGLADNILSETDTIETLPLEELLRLIK